MNEPVDARKTKERSPNFPFITLENALNRAQQFYNEEKRGAAPFLSAAIHWSYSPQSSGALQTVSALKNYGLMSEEPSASGRMLRLTDLALRILLDMRPGSKERIEFMREAALLPAVALKVYSKWTDALPSPATLNHYLVLDRGFSQANAVRTAQILIDNQEFANVLNSGTQSEQTEKSEEVNSHHEPMKQSIPLPAVTGTSNLTLGRSQQLKMERIKDSDNLDIVLQFEGEPSIANYEFLKDYIDLRIKALERAAKRDSEKNS